MHRITAAASLPFAVSRPVFSPKINTAPNIYKPHSLPLLLPHRSPPNFPPSLLPISRSASLTFHFLIFFPLLSFLR
ncbi:hypothetical protein IAS59_000551 [Cryptococcus gattii]